MSRKEKEEPERKKSGRFKALKVGSVPIRCGCGWSGSSSAWAEHRRTAHGEVKKK